MKIGILTFHRGINAGGFLQARSLSGLLKKAGHNVEIIDYVNQSQVEGEHAGIYRTRHPIRRWNNIRKARRYHEAIETLPLSRKVKGPEDFSSLDYDVVVFGSDEIWNLSSRLSGGDLTFFGKGIHHLPKVAYAPSFGSCPRSHPGIGEITDLLKDFQSIAVRDANSQAIVKKALGTQPELVVDPVLLSDQDQPIRNRKTGDSIGLYLMAPSEVDSRKVRAFAQERKMNTCSLGYHYSWADGNIASPMPGDLPGLLAGCELVVTNTFHGVVFSLKNELPFVVIDHIAKTQKIDVFRERLGLVTVPDDREVITSADINHFSGKNSHLAEWIESSRDCLLRSVAI